MTTNHDETVKFYRTVAAISTFDLEAAEWLLTEAPRVMGMNFTKMGNLFFIMTWKKTPQGHNYWARIHNKLVEMGHYNGDGYDELACLQDEDEVPFTGVIEEDEGHNTPIQYPVTTLKVRVKRGKNEWHHYADLIEDVRQIDENAAEYLEFEVHRLDSFNPSRDLAGVFLWEDSPQGRNYWDHICDQLGE